MVGRSFGSGMCVDAFVLMAVRLMVFAISLRWGNVLVDAVIVMLMMQSWQW